MQVTTQLLSREHDHDHEHDESCEHGHDHSHANVRLPVMIAGLAFVANGFFIEWAGKFGLLDGYLTSIRVNEISAAIGALILGTPIVWTALKDARLGRLSTNELVAIAVMASFASGHYYEAGVVSFFMLLGEIIETKTAAGARESIAQLIKLTPTRANRITNDNGGEEEVAVSALQVGDRIRVRPGDNVAADGVILSGSGAINEANVTGESLPRDKEAGDEVFQGTVNTTGVLEVRVTKAGQDTTFSRLQRMILDAERSKLPLMKIVDQYMGFYTPLVLVIGALVWAFTNDLSRVITVFIVSCPCAFILATPTAMVASLSAAARLGVLIKKVSDIEVAAKINAFVFDKTGTVTTGNLAVSRLAPAEGTKPAELLLTAATAEKYSKHPTALALARLADEAGLDLPEPGDFKEVAGQGVSARVEGDTVLVGRDIWLKQHDIGGDFAKSVDLDETEGYSLIYVAKNGKFIGWLGMSDQTRDESIESIETLREEGVRRVALVSGDRKPVAARVGNAIGCDEVAAECLPQHKVDFVKDTKKKGYHVAVVGDGVNDAPALAAGDLGIAMGAAGSDVAINSASIALMNSDLRRLPFLVRLSRMTRSVIFQNLLVGVLFVVGGLVMASMAYINPIVAAILHVLGGLIVVFNSARLVRQGEELEPFVEEDAGEEDASAEPQSSPVAA